MSSEMSIDKRNELLEGTKSEDTKDHFSSLNDNKTTESSEEVKKKISDDVDVNINDIVKNVEALAKSFKEDELKDKPKAEEEAVEEVEETDAGVEVPEGDPESLQAPVFEVETKSEKDKQGNHSLVSENRFSNSYSNQESGISFAENLLYVVAMAVSFGWLYYAHRVGILSLIAGSPDIASMANGLTALCSPLVLIWLIVLSCQRSTSEQKIVEIVRKEVRGLSPVSAVGDRFGEELSLLSEQTELIQTSTEASLKMIEKARLGLRSEMDEFANMSRQSEAHVVRLTNIMKERMSKLDTLSKALYGRTAKIGEKAEESGQALEKAASGLMKKVGYIENDMSNSVDKVVKVSDTVQGKIDQVKIILGQSVDGLREGADDVCERLQEASNQFTRHEKVLNERSEEFSDRGEKFDSLLNERISAFEELYDKMEAQLTSSKVSLDDERRSVHVASASLKESVESLNSDLESRVNDIYGVIDTLKDSGESIEVRMENRSEEIQRLVDNLDKQGDVFSEIGKSTSRRLGEAMSAALSSADVINNAVRKGAETLRTTADNAVAQSARNTELMIEKLEQLNKANDNIQDRVKACSSYFDESKALLDSASSSCEDKTESLKAVLSDHADVLHVSYSDLKEKLEKIRESFDDPVSAFETAIDKADINIDKIQNVIDQRISELGTTSERAVEQAAAIRQMLRGQSQELSSLSGQLSGNIKVINEQLSQQKEGLLEEVEDSVSAIGRVSSALGEQTSQVSRVALVVGEKIDALETKISARYDEIQQGAQRSFDVLDQVERSFHHSQEGFEGVVSELRSGVSGVVDGLDSFVTDISDRSDIALLKTETLRDEMSKLAKDVEFVSDLSSEKISNSLAGFDEKVSSIEVSTNSVAQKLKESSNELMVSVDQITVAANDASTQVERVGQTIEKQAQNVHLITDQASLRVENVQRMITERFHELSTSIGQSVSQLDDVGDKFSKCAVLIDETSDKIESRFVSVGKEARKEIKNLSDVAENVVLIATKSVGRLQEETGGMVVAAQKSLSVLNDLSEDYAERSTSLNAQMERSIQMSQDYGNKVRLQIADIGSVANETADQIVTQIGNMNDKMQDASLISDTISKKIAHNGGEVAEESSKLLTVSHKIEKILEGTSDIFVKQSSLLAKASEEAARQAKTIVDSDFHLKREAFFSSARFIVESLHSLSIDLTRLLSGGELPDKLWKSYQKGDKGVFTKYLLQLNDENSFEKIRKKYAEDHEFRNYVQRYFRQYEEVYNQAVKNDHGELLSMTFGSSDIGKLYHVLCSLMGHEACGVDKKIIN